jgi:hypothetical protein
MRPAFFPCLLTITALQAMPVHAEPSEFAEPLFATPPGANVACEMTVLDHRASSAWAWSWHWDASRRLLSNGDWSMRFDDRGNLIEEVQPSEGQRTLNVFDRMDNLISQQVETHGSIDNWRSFRQEVTAISPEGWTVALRGQTLSGSPRLVELERLTGIAPNIDGKVGRLVENGWITRFSYDRNGEPRPHRTAERLLTSLLLCH